MPRVQHKRGTSANLASVNPTPLAGELVWESDTNRLKVGNGTDAYTTLAFVGAASPTFTGQVTVAAGNAVAPSIVSPGASGTGLFFPDADAVAISTAGVSRVRISANGHVGIGKTPTVNLDVNGVIASVGGSASAPSQTFTGDQNSGIFSAGTNTFAVSTNGVERLRVDSSGRLGIGGTPTATLDVNADTMRLRTARTPASASATGNAGDICWDANYLYIAVATNTWRRISHASW